MEQHLRRTVQRQCSGTAGRTENCQIGVFAAYASPKGRALVDRELYLPKSCTSDPGRCRAAKVPDERGFATKGELAKAMVARALASPLPIAWVTADSAYGQERRFRRMLEEAGVGYVLAVPKSQHVHALGRIDFAIARAPEEVWERHSCGNGANGPRVYDWAAAQLPAIDDFDGDQPTRQRWVLARRSLARPEEIAYYLAYAPGGTTGAELVRVAGTRWAISVSHRRAATRSSGSEPRSALSRSAAIAAGSPPQVSPSTRIAVRRRQMWREDRQQSTRKSRASVSKP
ncbi:IS701 family transposase [Streptomyces sp. NPDC007983]|uniref:IS701 family transposase n=1 Tax=Streptomyces sp. NPDC007983 TaxID=3364800 RepID=UPI0036E30739